VCVCVCVCVCQVSEERTASVFMVEVILTHYLPSSYCKKDHFIHEDLVKQEKNLDLHIF